MNSWSRPIRNRCPITALVWVALCVPVALSGCSMCQECGDLDYPTYGGAWQRTRRDSGRVGSVFDPAGARMAQLSNRSAETDDPSLRKPSERTDELTPDLDETDKATGPDDVRGDEADGIIEPSPSDREKGENQKAEPKPNELRDLDLDDIRFQPSELLPPDI